MTQQDKKLPDNQEGIEFSCKPIEIPYTEGQKANGIDGKACDDKDFDFVQQDKSIHDVKFTTKPTTFFKDAMHRFRKNHSSVVGGVILGILFVLAIILPIDGVIPYSVEGATSNDSPVTPSGISLSYERNLPPKLFGTGTGFMDGTRSFKDQPYPYDEDGNYTGTDDPSCVVSVSSLAKTYQDSGTSVGDATGGYYVFSSNVTSSTEVNYAYSYKYNYSLSTDYNYMVSYDLGWKDEINYDKPEYAVILYYNNEVTPLTEWTNEYGTVISKEDKDSTVTPYETKTVNVSDLLKEKFVSTTTFNNASLGIAFRSSTSTKTKLMIKDFSITIDSTSTTSEIKRIKRELATRSFTDANTCYSQEKTVDGVNNSSYWASNATTKSLSDIITSRCTIVKDMYKVQYGLRTDLPSVSRSVFDNWITKGYINWDYNNPTFNQSITTEEGEASGKVYVTSVQSMNNKSGEDSITLQCTILTWKYLGYSSMPTHILGTDDKGRDLLKYVFLGLRTSLLLGLIVSAINILIGVIWGSISGYFGGITDIVMERIVDILNGIPWIVLMTVIVLKMGSNLFTFALALCLTGWIGTESVTRSQFYRYRDREYVLAARTLGAKSPRLIFRHILPNAIGTIVTSSILMIPSVIFSEATISYLGLGLRGIASLGVILSDNQKVFQSYPFELVVPAVIISLLMICFNLFGNGLRDAFNPSLKGDD